MACVPSANGRVWGQALLRTASLGAIYLLINLRKPPLFAMPSHHLD